MPGEWDLLTHELRQLGWMQVWLDIYIWYYILEFYVHPYS